MRKPFLEALARQSMSGAVSLHGTAVGGSTELGAASIAAAVSRIPSCQEYLEAQAPAEPQPPAPPNRRARRQYSKKG